jgi:DNA polymerase III subunit delta'
MVTLAQLPWLSPAREGFMAQLHSGRLSHAQLVGIDEGHGGLLLAQFFAKVALCLQPGVDGACGLCKACQLFAAGNHPDYYQVQADGNQIKIDQIRELCRQLTATAQQGGRRVALIAHSERLNTAAANALLKTLEEPGKDTLLLLQSDTPARLMATIASRCQRVTFTPPSRQVLGEWLVRECQMYHDASWCLPVVGGPIRLAGSLANGQYEQLLRLRKDWAQSLSCGHLCASLLTVGEQQITDALKVLYVILRQHLLLEKYSDALTKAKLVGLAAKIMDLCHDLTLMPNINYLALCQSLVLEYSSLVSK